MSRIGKQTISLPEKVSITTGDGRKLSVEGPKGKLEWELPEGIRLEQNDGEVEVKRLCEDRKVRALHGLSRSLVANMVEGVSTGFVKDLEILGVGFRAAVKGNALDLSLGFSHPVEHPIPDDLTVTVTENTKIRVEGIDKQKVGQFAAHVRSYYPPEPYKGKGVRYANEHVRRKDGKGVQ
jgi:large subunit ribosomal protein L6